MTSFLHPNSKTFRKTPFFPFDKNFVVGLYSILVPPFPCIKCQYTFPS